MTKCKAGAWLAIVLIMFFTATKAPAQWSSLKHALQKDVKILTESKTRLVLFQEAAGISLILTPVREPDTDIYGDFEARRGGNPYRVWVITEKFSQNPQFAKEAEKYFFKESFLKTLRWEAPSAEPASPEILQTMEKPDTGVVPDSNSTQAEQEPTQDLNIETAPIVVMAADSLRRAESQDTVQIALTQPDGQLAPQKSAAVVTVHEPSQKRGPGKSDQRFGTQSGKVTPPLPTHREAVTAAPSFARVDSLYQSALAAMEQKNWPQAAFALEKIHQLQPDYKDVVDLLARVRANLLLAEKTAVGIAPPPNDGRHLFVGGAIVTIGAFIALIVLPFIGVLLISQTIRAQYHIFRGHYLEAAQIYEKSLARRPDRKKLIAALATLYLRLGRRDEAALKIYEKALQLNLIVRNHEEINAIVSQNYLTKGRTDPDVIEVLEDALKAERLKQKPRKS